MNAEQKKREPQDVQHGIWNAETIAEIDYKAGYGKHRIRGCGATRYMPTFDDLMILPSQLTIPTGSLARPGRSWGNAPPPNLW
jgi:hypothetical protein